MGQGAPIEPEVNPTTGTETETETTNSGYVKQTWSTGDVITADKMNHIEEGIENTSTGGVFYATFTLEGTENNISASSDKTFNQIKNAYDAGQVIMGRLSENSGSTAEIYTITPLAYVSFGGNSGAFGFLFMSLMSRDALDAEGFEMHSDIMAIRVVKTGGTESIQVEDERTSWPCEIYGEQLND